MSTLDVGLWACVVFYVFYVGLAFAAMLACEDRNSAACELFNRVFKVWCITVLLSILAYEFAVWVLARKEIETKNEEPQEIKEPLLTP